ncbi:serine/threonine protein kinase [Actinoplanes sp. NBRC 103695]|uniref:serine/threonine protein kinase n=1 Tax=Actinoplanes sp. NBRC 103695 TaxID=3032202 RepID=UPI0025553842|nr:serine/threonine protein kinase [Actinoplanes sp. NBRC 103695]
MPTGVIANRYRLVALVGAGGMGRVWAARDELLGREVAVKELVLPKGLSEVEQADLRVRVIREARAIARIDHPNVVRIYDVLHQRGEPWIVMELVPSRSLFDVVSKDGPMQPARAAEVGLGVLAALRAAHQAGLLHRDVKPANVLLGAAGRVVLTDFGLATAAGDSSMTSTGVVLGSPSYLAPERALDEPIGPPADLWSLGATLYAAVEGRPPYSKSSPMATLAALATEPPRPPTQAGSLKPALDGLLQRDPAKRADAATAERLLRAALTGVPPRKSRRKLIAALVAAAAVVAIVGITAPPMLTTAQDTPVLVPAPQTVPSSAPGAPFVPPSVPAAKPQASASEQQAPVPSAGPTKRKPVAPSKPSSTPAKPAAAGSPLENVQSGTCLHLPDSGGALQLGSCDGTAGQKFNLATDGTLRVLGKCVQIQGTDNGARLLAATCSGSAFQKFAYRNASDLVSVAADKCVDAPDGSSAGGAQAQIWGCNGTGNQKWRH